MVNIQMDYESFKTFLLRQPFILSMDPEDKAFFTNKCKNSKTIHSTMFYIKKYGLTDEAIAFLNKYNFYTQNQVPNMIIL